MCLASDDVDDDDIDDDELYYNALEYSNDDTGMLIFSIV